MCSRNRCRAAVRWRLVRALWLREHEGAMVKTNRGRTHMLTHDGGRCKEYGSWLGYRMHALRWLRQAARPSSQHTILSRACAGAWQSRPTILMPMCRSSQARHEHQTYNQSLQQSCSAKGAATVRVCARMYVRLKIFSRNAKPTQTEWIHYYYHYLFFSQGLGLAPLQVRRQVAASLWVPC